MAVCGMGSVVEPDFLPPPLPLKASTRDRTGSRKSAADAARHGQRERRQIQPPGMHLHHNTARKLDAAKSASRTGARFLMRRTTALEAIVDAINTLR